MPRSSNEMIGRRFLPGQFCVAIGQALQFGSLRRYAFGGCAHRHFVGERSEMICERELVGLRHG